ncbi:MAG: thermonuclease family protein [Nitrospirales bacterium]
MVCQCGNCRRFPIQGHSSHRWRYHHGSEYYNEQGKVPLNGIDCPEKAQAYGNKEKQFIKELVAGQAVTIQAHDRDKYGRTIGDGFLEGLLANGSTIFC